MSRIEQLISDIESYIDTCKYYPLSNVKIIVNKEQLEDMLTELMISRIIVIISDRIFRLEIFILLCLQRHFLME